MQIGVKKQYRSRNGLHTIKFLIFVSYLNMTPRLTLFLLPQVFLCLLFNGTALGQANKYKNVFVGPHFEYLEFRNDTTLVTNINEADWDTTSYLINADTLLIKKEHWESFRGVDHHWVEWRPFQLLSRGPDSILLRSPAREPTKGSRKTDTLRFVRLEKLKEQIRDFTYFNIHEESPWVGSLDFTIDSGGRLVFYGQVENPRDHSDKVPNQAVARVLSKQEFAMFKDLLSYSVLSKWHRFRGGCDAIDAGRTTFEIDYDGKKHVSKGCEIEWPQAFLYNYVFDLANRKTYRAK
jgi:hypothetical protein